MFNEPATYADYSANESAFCELMGSLLAQTVSRDLDGDGAAAVNRQQLPTGPPL